MTRSDNRSNDKWDEYLKTNNHKTKNHNGHVSTDRMDRLQSDTGHDLSLRDQWVRETKIRNGRRIRRDRIVERSCSNVEFKLESVAQRPRIDVGNNGSQDRRIRASLLGGRSGNRSFSLGRIGRRKMHELSLRRDREKKSYQPNRRIG